MRLDSIQSFLRTSGLPKPPPGYERVKAHISSQPCETCPPGFLCKRFKEFYLILLKKGVVQLATRTVRLLTTSHLLVTSGLGV